MHDALQTLLDGGPVDPELLENLRQADPEMIRSVLSTHMREDEIEALLGRLAALLEARPA